MKFNNAIPGLIVLLFGAYAWWESASYPPGISGGYGSAFFPRVIGTVMIGLGTLLILSGLRTLRAGGWAHMEGWATARRPLAGVAILIGALAFMTLAMEPLGFPLSAFLATFAFTVYLRARWISSLAISGAAVLAIHFLFAEVFSVVLPLGVLDALIR